MTDVDRLSGNVFTCNAYEAGFNIRPHDIRQHPEARPAVGDCRDLLLTRPNIVYADICRESLFSVNGLLYPGNSTDEGICLKGAFCSTYSKTQVSLLRFAKVGVLKFQPLTREAIEESIKTTTLNNSLYIDLPENASKRKIFAVIGGHLHVGDDVLRMVSATKARIDTSNLPIVQRVIDSLDKVDFSFTNKVTRPDGAVHVSSLQSNEILTEYLLHGNSFICWLDIDNVEVEKRYIESTGFPGKYLVDSTFNGLVMLENGTIADYKVSGNVGAPILETTPVIISRRRFETTDWRNNDWVTAARDPVGRVDYARAYQLIIKN